MFGIAECIPGLGLFAFVIEHLAYELLSQRQQPQPRVEGRLSNSHIDWYNAVTDITRRRTDFRTLMLLEKYYLLLKNQKAESWETMVKLGDHCFLWG